MLRRDYPQIAVFVGTRRHALPIEGVVVEIERLSDDQQLEIARAQRGSEGEALVDEAWRSPGVRELIAIPLYLNERARAVGQWVALARTAALMHF